MANPGRKGNSKGTAAAPPVNKVHEYREHLGLSKVDLAGLADLSDKTVARVERMEQSFRAITYRRIFNALNDERRKRGWKELEFEEVFPKVGK